MKPSLLVRKCNPNEHIDGVVTPKWLGIDEIKPLGIESEGIRG
jgi:hypothetical protein